MSEPRVIVALDYPTAEQARFFVDRVRPESCRLKVGKELFVAAGPAFVEDLVARGGVNLFYESVENRKACCRVRKVLPLGRKLARSRGGRRPWVHVSGRREALAAGRF